MFFLSFDNFYNCSCVNVAGPDQPWALETELLSYGLGTRHSLGAGGLLFLGARPGHPSVHIRGS